MKKVFFVCFFIWMTASVKASDKPDINTIKLALEIGVESSKTTDSIYKVLIAYKSADPLIIAFTGTAEALKAKHAWNPYNKLRFIMKASKTMRKAVDGDPNNVDIRFMRFSIQHFTPVFLGYSKELDEDRKFLVQSVSKKQFGTFDSVMVQKVLKFLIDSQRCTPEELVILKKIQSS